MCKKLLTFLLVLCLATAANAAVVNQWDFEEGAGTDVSDSVGTADGTMAGSGHTWVAGKVGTSALSFNDTSWVVADGTGVGVGITNEVTFATWVKPAATMTGGDILMVTMTPMPAYAYIGTGSASWYSGGFGLGFAATYDFSSLLDTWVHVAATKDAVSGSMVIYVDGAAIGSVGNQHDAPGDGTGAATAHIGAFEISGTTLHLDGAMDDTRLYDEYMSAGDVQRFLGTEDANQAWGPDPKLSEQVTSDVILSWTAGASATGHTIYLSTDQNSVADRSAPSATSATAQYDPPGLLDTNSTYYWAVDENDGSAGDVWVFEAPIVPDPDLDLWLKLDAHSGPITSPVTYFDYSYHGNTGSLGYLGGKTEMSAYSVAGAPLAPDQGSPNLGVHFDANSNLNPGPACLNGAKASGGITMAFWQNFEDLDPSDGNGYIVSDTGGAAGFRWAFPYTGGKVFYIWMGTYGENIWENLTNPADYSGGWNHWAVTKDTTANSMIAYLNGAVKFVSATNNTTKITSAPYLSFGSGGGWSGGYMVNGAMDDIKICNKAFPASGIQRLAGLIEQTQAYWETPANGATNVPYLAPLTLSWKAGDGAQTHNVNFGTSTPPPSVATGLTAATHDITSNLSLSKTYYWSVDEVSTVHGTVAGEIWSFTAQPSVVLEDFESYANDAALEAAWDDDFGGAYTDLSTDAHGGAQAMSLAYENNLSPYYTAITKALSPAADFAVEGAKALELWYKGDLMNTSQPLYVEVSSVGKTDKAINSDPDALRNRNWTPWNIDMTTEFTTVALGAVTSIAIGTGNGSSSSGQTIEDSILIDDISLYPTRCVAEYGPTCDVSGDCKVDLVDAKVMNEQWLDCTIPGGAGCESALDPAIVATPITLTVDGDLSEWSGAVWNTVPQPFSGYIVTNVNDVTNIEYAMGWNPSDPCKLYYAVKVTDTDHALVTDPNQLTVDIWDSGDLLELRVEASGEGLDGTAYTEDMATAQMYNLVPDANGTLYTVWGNSYLSAPPTVFTDSPDAELDADYALDGDTIIYEAAATTWLHYDGFVGGTPTKRTLGVGSIFRFDIQIDGKKGVGAPTGAIMLEGSQASKPSIWPEIQIVGSVPTSCGDWGYSQTDFNKDCSVDLLDYAALANQYLDESTWP